MLEVEVHQQLHAFLRNQGEGYWPHQLTVARLVARALRLQRSALIQVSAAAKYQGHYRFSYLVPAMLWPDPVILVAPMAIQTQILRSAIPRLQDWLGLYKPVCTAEQWPGPQFTGLLLLSPSQWLTDYFSCQPGFPQGVLTLIDGAEYLGTWTQQHLTLTLGPQDWEQLQWCYPQHIPIFREARAQLTHRVFQHPVNPYECALIDQPERRILTALHRTLRAGDLTLSPKPWQQFWDQYEQPDQLLWTEINRQQGTFTLCCAPIEIQPQLQNLWSRQAVILLGGEVDDQADAPCYRQFLGLGPLTCVQFAADRRTEAIQLYLPDGLPMPNTPEFQARLVEQIHYLMMASQAAAQATPRVTVLIIEALPLRSQIAAILAAEFGSRVQVEASPLSPDRILVTGWEFWLQIQHQIAAPPLLIIATLPIPSLEDPRVAGRVAYYKRRRQDWFRLYLLPEALRMLQGAIAPVREQQGVVALLDNRVLHRSYGHRVLAALSPYARLNYIDASLFQTTPQPLLDRA